MLGTSSSLNPSDLQNVLVRSTVDMVLGGYVRRIS